MQIFSHDCAGCKAQICFSFAPAQHEMFCRNCVAKLIGLMRNMVHEHQVEYDGFVHEMCRGMSVCLNGGRNYSTNKSE